VVAVTLRSGHHARVPYLPLVAVLIAALLAVGCSSPADDASAAAETAQDRTNEELADQLDRFGSELDELRGELLDEDGGPRIDALDAQLAAVSEELAELEDALRAEREARAAGDERLEETLAGADGRIERLEASIRDTASAVQEIREAVNAIRRDLGDLRSRHNLLEERFENSR
jgi:chromosome segregation ATPase